MKRAIELLHEPVPGDGDSLGCLPGVAPHHGHQVPPEALQAEAGQAQAVRGLLLQPRVSVTIPGWSM